MKKELEDKYLTLALYPFMIAFVRSKTWKTFEEFRQDLEINLSNRPGAALKALAELVF